MKREEFVKRMEEVEERIGYAFRDKDLLRRCFTLSSADADNNERLEFFGDAILELVASEWLYFNTDMPEGDMNDLRKMLVRDENLSAVATRMGLDEFLIYEGNLGKKPVASIIEALAAGIYIDGGKDEALRVLHDKVQVVTDTRNYRGELQEYLSRLGEKPEYAPTERTGGTDNDPVFTSRVSACGKVANATVRGKKADAEKEAAKKLLKLLTEGTK